MTIIGNFKVCKICGINKKLTEFWDGRTCKECKKEELRNKTRVRYKKEGKPYPGDFDPGYCMYCGATHNEKTFSIIKETGKFNKICNPCRWKRQNKKRHYNRKLKREKTDSKTRINKLMRNGIRKALKSKNIAKNGHSWLSFVDYSTEDLLNHLKKSLRQLNKKLDTKYIWQDFMEAKLHIDHIVPIAMFNYKSTDDPEFKRCWSLENLQLLPAFDNISKSNKCESFQIGF